jgi:hypothetical protein
MAELIRSDEAGHRRGLRGAAFVQADLSGVVVRCVDVAGAGIDAP